MIESGISTHRNNNKNAAILFIHGFLGDPKKTWGEFPTLIQQDFLLDNWDLYTFGYSTSFLPDIRGIWSADASLGELAVLLKTEVETSPLKNYKDIILIAHSMGGLITQKAIIDSDSLKNRLKCLIMFGTPSNGLKKAIPLNWFKRQLRDLSKDSDFIKELRAEWNNKITGKYNFNLCVCAGERDEFVPSSSSLFPFEDNVRYLVNGNHLEMIKPEKIESISYRLVRDNILGNIENNYPYNLGNVLAELVQFEKVIKKFEGKAEQLDEQSLVTYSLALDSLGYRDKAIEMLEKYNKERTDALGTLAGRHKRIWLNEGLEKHAKCAYEIYSKAFDISKASNNIKQMYYHKINQAFLEKVYLHDKDKARKTAKIAKEICYGLELGIWESATIGEANLHIKPEEAIQYYKKV
ncbi:MAG: alpha/beta fold hydrolase, partial [Ignavibacteriae bacterium]|nr:alpha/beta fold hydrolase [Ignavibacteriota bacterium]